MRVVWLLVLTVASTQVQAQQPDNALVRESFISQFFKIFHSLIPGESSNDFSTVERLKNDYVAQYKLQSSRGYDPDSLAYFKIFPKYITTLSPGSSVDVYETCWDSVKVHSEVADDQSTTVTISLDGPDSLLCHISLILSTGSEIHVKEFWSSGSHEVKFSPPKTEAEQWDVIQRGPRLFVYPISPELITYNLAATLALFEPVLTQAVAPIFADMNRDFLSAFVGIDMEPRQDNVPDILDIPKQMIRNGDTFNIMRLDGLDPMIAWAMGAATGHTVVAMWRDLELYLCESNAFSPYWPVNGVQCNRYEEWTQYALGADYNVVWAPMEQSINDGMNMTKAWEFVDSMIGIDYGYEVVLTGLLDTLYDNLPCAGSNNTFCLEPEHFEMLFSYVERLSDEVARVFKPAIMQRAGLSFDKPLVEAYYAAHLAGVEVTMLPLLPEKDGWIYPTTRDGKPELSPVMICNVFVCNVWKHAGVFSGIEDDIQCGETSVNDNYRLKLYSNEPKPAFCSEVENPLCQLTGKYQLRLDSQPGVPPRYNYVPVSPGLLESCPSKAPNYLAPQDC